MSDRRKNTFKEEVAREKLIAAEGHLSIIRLIIVLVNTFIYFAFLGSANTVPWLAYIIIATSITYSLYYVFYRPYLKHSLLLNSYVTTIADGAFIVGWIIATGIAESPFYLLWCLSIVAVSQRYSFSETMMVSAIYAATDLILINFDLDAPVSTAELAVRILYIPITGLLGAYFSGEISGQIHDKLISRQSENKARKAETKLRGLLDDLNTQIEEKIKAETKLKKMQAGLELKIKERTKDLEELNEELKREIQEKEKIRLEQAKTLGKLEEINKELESFAYVTSHDLKAPLRGIATLSDWIYGDYGDQLDEEGRVKLKLLKERVERMNDLIEGILQYSRVGRTEETPQRTDLGQVVTDLISILSPPESIEVKVVNELPFVFANTTQLTQVYENLISNAIKYMDKKEGMIEIGTEQKMNEFVFYVKDNGPGIPSKYHQKIFEMFQTLNKDKKIDSTGIGLAVARKIVNKMGGKLWVESENGQGSTFRFTLPKTIVELHEHGKTG